MSRNKILALVLFLNVILGTLLVPWEAAAVEKNMFEYSAGFSYNRTQFGGGSYTWERRWSTSIGYNLNDAAEIEISFQDVATNNRFISVEDSTYHDQIYSANWVQSFLGKRYAFQPYGKIGIGQLNRDATVTDAYYHITTTTEDQITGILGAGFKLFLTREFALRIEATTYLSGARLGSWQDNIATTVGASIYF